MSLLGKKDLVLTTIQSNPRQMGSPCDLDMENIITTLLKDLTQEEQQKFQALEEYMKVQFQAGVKKCHYGKVARLKEFEPSTIKLNDNNVGVITTISQPPLNILEFGCM